MPPNKYNYVFFSDQWGRFPSSAQHIATNLLQRNRVLWVNTIGMRKPSFSLYDLKRGFEVISSWIFKSHDTGTDHPNLTVYNPFIIPFNEIKLIRLLNNMIVKWFFRKCMVTHQFEKPIIIITHPNAVRFVEKIEHSLLVYYCVDDFTNWPGTNKNLLIAFEQDLILKSDLIIATSKKLCEDKASSKTKPVFIGHGVEYDHFSTAMTDNNAESKFSSICGPIIGFFGAISPWMDFNLLVDMANKKPEWSFVFLGPVDSDITMLDKLDNVYFLYKIPYKDLPSLAKHFDVGIIPFLINDLTIYVNPLKLLEYFALGLPVVSVPLPELVRYKENIELANTSEQFLEKIQHLLINDTFEARKERIEIARNNSWKRISDIFHNTIISTIESKRNFD